MKIRKKKSAKVFPCSFPNPSMVVTKAQLGLAAFMVYYIPDIVFFAVDFPVTHEASALLVQKLLAYTTLEASRMPLQVGCHT